MQNIYHSEYLQTANQKEFNHVDRRYQQALNPLESGVVPKPAYASMFQNPQNVDGGNGYVESLAGTKISRENFTHNNMQPFFGGRVRQNVDVERGLNKLENFTGAGGYWKKKQEVLKEDITPTMRGLTNICGMTTDNDYMKQRVVEPVSRNNEFPIQQENTSIRLEAADVISLLPKPKTVDDLRVKPKVVTEGRQASGAKGTIQPTQAPTIVKNRPETLFTPVAPVPTMSQVTKESQRPVVELQDVTRGITDDNMTGPAGPATVQVGDTRDTNYILQPTQSLGELPNGNVRMVVPADDDDYGKTNVQVYCNERTQITTKTVTNNLTVSVKAAIAPILDIFRGTKQEFTIDSARPMGELQAGATIPAKPTTYDPVLHQMKTTIKETTIHDTTITNLKGPEQGRDQDPEAPLPTIRDTLELKEEMRNLRSGTYKVTVYNPDEVARTTIRETTTENTHTGIVDNSTGQRGAYTYIEVNVPNTQKQFVSDSEYMANPTRTAQDGYKVVQYVFVPKNTQKQFVSDSEYMGNAATVEAKKQTSFSMWKWLKNKMGKEEIEVARIPTTSGPKNAAGAETIALKLSKNPQLEESARVFGNQKANEGPSDTSVLGTMTKQRGLLEKSKDDRLDPSLLAAFHDNPYTKPLTSVAAY